MTIHAGLVTQTVGAFVQVYSQSVNIFLFILDTASFWVPIYLNLLFDFLPDINECRSQSHGCHLNANCINTAGSHYCTCRTGYNGNGIICTGIIKQYVSLFLVKYEIIPSKPAPNVRKRVPDRSKVKTLLPKRCALRKFLMQVEDKSSVIKLLSMHSIRSTNRAAHA